jgi:hypothetical protein
MRGTSADVAMFGVFWKRAVLLAEVLCARRGVRRAQQVTGSPQMPRSGVADAGKWCCWCADVAAGKRGQSWLGCAGGAYQAKASRRR